MLVWLVLAAIPSVIILEISSCRDVAGRKHKPVEIRSGVWAKAIEKHTDALRGRSVFERAIRRAPTGTTLAEARSKQSQPMREASAGGGRHALSKGRVFVRIELNNVDFYIGKAAVLRGLRTQMQHGQLVGLLGESGTDPDPNRNRNSPSPAPSHNPKMDSQLEPEPELEPKPKPPGSGKTTLLNILGGRASYGWVSGSLILNRRPFRPDKIRHLLGYVPQAHLVFKELTVYECVSSLCWGTIQTYMRVSDGAIPLRTWQESSLCREGAPRPARARSAAYTAGRDGLGAPRSQRVPPFRVRPLHRRATLRRTDSPDWHRY